MKIEWSDDALTDLDRFAEFLQERHPSLATIVAEEIIRCVQVLAEHPLLGQPISDRGEYRQLLMQVLNAPYVFHYRYDGKRCDITRLPRSQEA